MGESGIACIVLYFYPSLCLKTGIVTFVTLPECLEVTVEYFYQRGGWKLLTEGDKCHYIEFVRLLPLQRTPVFKQSEG